MYSHAQHKHTHTHAHTLPFPLDRGRCSPCRAQGQAAPHALHGSGAAGPATAGKRGRGWKCTCTCCASTCCCTDPCCCCCSYPWHALPEPYPACATATKQHQCSGVAGVCVCTCVRACFVCVRMCVCVCVFVCMWVCMCMYLCLFLRLCSSSVQQLLL